MKVLTGFSIQTQLVASAVFYPGLLGSGDDGAQFIYFFFRLSRRYHELFSPTTSRTALPKRSGIQEKRKRNNNIIIMKSRGHICVHFAHRP